MTAVRVLRIPLEINDGGGRRLIGEFFVFVGSKCGFDIKISIFDISKMFVELTLQKHCIISYSDLECDKFAKSFILSCPNLFRREAGR